jgi:RNA-directed DNA polymerase
VRPNHPKDKVRELQRRLWVCAKQSRTRRFHALYDRTYRGDVLWEAWRRVRRNRGTAGVDRESLEAIEAQGVETWLEELQAELRAGRYRPRPVKRRYIPKGQGGHRPLGIPTVRDRVVQMATKLVIEPIFEADFKESSYGFRPKRSATQALERIRENGNQGYNFVVDADIRSFFDQIDQEKLMLLVERRISDRRVLKLIRKWLRAGVMEDGTIRETLAGTPQGGVISPLLANLYLHVLDTLWERHCAHLGELVRYADDFVVMCRHRSQAQRARHQIEQILDRLGLQLHPDKTRMVDLGWGKDSFEFLGCTIRKKRSIQRNPRWYFMQRWPSPRAMKRIRGRIHDLTSSRRAGVSDVKQLIASLNPVLRGWGNYFRSGNAETKFNRLDDYVRQRILRWQWRRGGQRRRNRYDKWPHERLCEMGLHQLRGTVKYPANATPRRPLVSRVREIRTHGLKGGLTDNGPVSKSAPGK